MKRIIAIFLVAGLLITVSACGVGTDSPDPESPASGSSEAESLTEESSELQEESKENEGEIEDTGMTDGEDTSQPSGAASSETLQEETAEAVNQDEIPAETQDDSLAGETSADEEIAAPAAAGTTTINITAGDTVISAVLDDSEIAREFVSMLPQTISMSRIRSREVYGARQGELSTQAPVETSFANGDVAYWFSGNSLCLFYADDDTDGTVSSGIMKLGRITSDLSAIASLDSNVEMTVSLA